MGDARRGILQSEETTALEIIREALSRAANPCIAFSGGHDSTVIAHLVDQVDDSVPLLYCDEELLYPEHIDHMSFLKLWYGPRMRVVPGGNLLAGWFIPWKTSPRWRIAAKSMRMEARDWEREVKAATQPGLRLAQIAAALGFDAILLGQRRDEELRRPDLIVPTKTTEPVADISYTNPILDWSGENVLQYILDRQLVVCPVYDRLTEVGIDHKKHRLGPLPLADHRHLKAAWPALYRDLISLYGPRWTA